jgi:hypothetical protein
MYEPHKKHQEHDKPYNLNSFRGTLSDKAKQKDSRLMSPKELLQSIDKGDSGEHKMKNKPRLLTARLPPPFSMKSNGHFGDENISPKKIIVDRHPDLLSGDNEVSTHKQLNSYYISYVIEYLI